MFKPNEEQKKVIYCDSDKIVVVAGAGSGKTASLVHRVKRLVDDGVDPSSILVLTFTRAAAFEMRDRYVSIMSHSNKDIPEFKTFHAFCYSLISNDVNVLRSIGYNTVPDVVDNGEDTKYKQMARVQSGTKMSQKKLDSELDSLSLKERREYTIYKKILQKLLCESNMITFDDLFAKVCKLFKDSDPCVDKYKKQYRHIIIDEFQDTDPKQWEFALSIPNCNICVIGDALQSLYSFRGADSKLIKSLTEDPDWTKINLSNNYRSDKAIVNFANKNTRYAAGKSYRNIMNVTHEDNGKVDVTYFDDRKKSYAGMYLQPCESSYIRTIQDKFKTGNTAILCRSNSEVGAVCDELTDAGIEYSTSSNNSEVCHYIKSIIDNQYMINWVATYLTSASYTSYLKQLKLRNNSTEDVVESELTWFYKRIATPIIQSKMNTVFQLRTILNDKSLKPCQRVIDCLSLLNLKCLVDYDQEFEHMKDAIQYMLEIADNENNESSIYVGTIHSVKGLEFDNVVLLGVNDSSFKLNTEDNLNVYYVGITRAKHNLTVFKYSE